MESYLVKLFVEYGPIGIVAVSIGYFISHSKITIEFPYKNKDKDKD